MLENLLSSKPKNKLLAVFLSFPRRGFAIAELARTADSSVRATAENVREFVRAGVVSAGSRGRTRLFCANPTYAFYQELFDLLKNDLEKEGEDLVSRMLKKISGAKLVVLSGAFSFQTNQPTDLLIVGSHIRRSRLDKILSELEKLTGMDMGYAVMDVQEYEYRRMMNDRFIRDIFDYPHLVVLNLLKHRKR